MQGIPAGFALTAISNYLLGKHIEPQRVGTFIALVGLPWTLQFVWGPLIDRYQYSVIGHRKQWVVLSQLAAIIVSLALLGIKDLQNEIPMLSLVFCIHSVFASIQVASVDAMAISIAPLNERGKLNGFMRGGFLLGIAFGSAVLSFVLHNFSFRSAALLQTLALSIFSIVFFFTKIDRKDLLLPVLWNSKKQQIAEAANPDLRLVFKKVYMAITSPKSLKYFSVVAIVYFCSSVFIRSYTYHLINVLKWPDKSVSMLQGSWGSVITFVAILIAGAASDKIGAKRMQVKVMWGVRFFLILLNCSSRLWHYDIFSGCALILWNLADPLLSVTIFSILMGLCWEKVEGSQFTSYLALINLCDVTGSYVTGWCLGTISAPVLGLTCGV
ncbi:MAG: MFS transporter, partial [Chitinophagaceae bacterium]